MSDTPQGPGWWQASDDKWYPPPRPQMPGDEAAPVTAVGPTTAAPTTVAPTTMAPPYGAPGGPGGPSSGGFPAGPPTAISGQGFAPPGAPGGPGGPPSLPGAQPSPYGMPPVAPQPSGQNRTPLFIALGVVVAAALVGLILMLTSGGDDEPTADPGPSTTAAPGTTAGPDTTAGPATTAGPGTTEAAGGNTGGSTGGQGSEEIKVTESGFSVYTDQLSEEQRVSYGFVIQNNTENVATGVPITVAFLDDAGTVVGNADENIGVLLPGQKMGIGDEPYDVGAAATMQVTVGEPSSWEAPSDTYGEISAEGITTTIDDYGAPTSTFTANSTYGEQIDSPNAYALYRNSGGDIVGGSYGFLNFVPANGSTAGDVTSYSSIPDVDGSKTEIYVDPGYIF